MADGIKFTIPWPPSVNHYWMSLRKGPLAGRVIISTKGKKYRKDVQRALFEQRVPVGKLLGRVRIRAVAFPPDRRARDLDNLWKAALDSITACEVLVDDSHIDDLHIVRGAVSKGLGLLEIEASEITEAFESRQQGFELAPAQSQNPF